MRYLLIFLTLLFAVPFVSAQTAASTPTPSPTPDAEKEKARMIAFLRDVDQEVSNLRLPENRVALFAEVASVMWQFDETQARSIYSKAANDLRQIMMSYSTAAADAKAAQAADPDALTASFVGNPYRDAMANKGRELLAVRAQILISIAENDPEFALQVLADTAGLVVADGRYSSGDDDVRLRDEIAAMSARRSPKRALEIALESLKKELNNTHFRILRELNEVDGEAAKTLASAMLAKAKGDKTNAYLLSEFLKNIDSYLEAEKKKSAKPSPFSIADARQVAESLVDQLGDQTFLPGLDLIEKYLPARAAALKAKAAAKARMNGGYAANRANAAANVASTRSSNLNEPERAEQEKWKKLAEDRKSLDVFSKLSSGNLPPEEREKVLAEARKTVARLRDPRDKVIALSAIATGVVGSDKQLALDLMREADRVAPLYPKNYADFMVVFAVASGYAMVDPEQAFPRIENLIASTNEIINAGVKVAEFIDVPGEIVEDNEVKIGAFGGPMGASMLRRMSIANVPLKKLAEFDLDRTRALADRFDRPEARVLAKILILRAYTQAPAEKPTNTERTST
ncbi:MAG: hypothetical protein R2682_08540 [Pyrinomonadaceae bacterium]